MFLDHAMKRPVRYAALGLATAAMARGLYRHLTRFDFRNRTVLITGASRGLGLVLARQFADRAARVAICARDAGPLQRAADELSRRGAEVLAIPCDVAQRDQVMSMVEQIDQRWGAIDVVVNNAGIIQTGPLESMTLEDYDQAIQTHFYGPLHVVQAVLPQMRQRRAGRIVNISSIGGRVSVPHMLPYSASKFALVGYSLGLRSELAKDGIAVTTICPGLMRTGSPRNALFKGRHRAEYAWFKISDSLPIVSLGAERAARQILHACQYGEAFVVLGAPLKVAEKLYSLFPGLGADALAVMDRLLPAPGGIGQRRLPGSESRSSWSESWLTRLSDRAAAANNEL